MVNNGSSFTDLLLGVKKLPSLLEAEERGRKDLGVLEAFGVANVSGVSSERDGLVGVGRGVARIEGMFSF